MRNITTILTTTVMAAVLLTLAACSGSGDIADATDGTGGGAAADSIPTATVLVMVQAPQNPTTRSTPGDPGDDVQEAEDWDAMYIIWAYTVDGNGDTYNNVGYKKLTKTEFEALPVFDDAGKYRKLSLAMPTGKTYLYAVSCTDALYDPTADIKKCTTYTEVESLTIPNDYGSNVSDGTRWDKFCSVATGYCVASKEVDTDYTPEGDRLLTIEDVGTSVSDRVYCYLPLKRLASKIDIQWDAQDAYTDAKYEDVRIKTFTFNGGGTNITGTGHGRLFPALYSTDVQSKTYISGTSDFFNTNVISQRNGRQYHYVFPDGASEPSFTFTATAKKINDNNTTTDKTTDGTLKLGTTLQQGAWYKVNLTVKGMTSTGTWEYTLTN